MTGTARCYDKFCSVDTRGGTLCLHLSPSKDSEFYGVQSATGRLRESSFESGDGSSGLGTIRIFNEPLQNANQCLKLNSTGRQSNSSVALQVYLLLM